MASYGNNMNFKVNLLPEDNGEGDLGNSSKRWSSIHVGSKDTYGSDKVPIYMDNGVPTEGAETYVFYDDEIETIASEASAIVNAVYPVGSIYLTVNQTHPNTLFPGTTWVAWGAGRVPVGMADSGTFGSPVESTGGTETVTADGIVGDHAITIAEMPAHSHSVGINVQGYSGWSQQTLDSYIVAINYSAGGNYHNPSTKLNMAMTSGGQTYSSGGSASHNHGFIGTAHSNLQPYITCYMWKRTA